MTTSLRLSLVYSSAGIPTVPLERYAPSAAERIMYVSFSSILKSSMRSRKRLQPSCPQVHWVSTSTPAWWAMPPRRQKQRRGASGKPAFRTMTPFDQPRRSVSKSLASSKAHSRFAIASLFILVTKHVKCFGRFRLTLAVRRLRRATDVAHEVPQAETILPDRHQCTPPDERSSPSRPHPCLRWIPYPYRRLRRTSRTCPGSAGIDKQPPTSLPPTRPWCT